MLEIGIILGSVRTERKGKSVADWTLAEASSSKKELKVEYELVDLANYDLPFLGTVPNASQSKAIQEWSKKIASFDGYIFITAEYNHGVPGSFKNALDFLKDEFKNKVVAFVGYGGLGASRSIENLRVIVAEQGLASIQKTTNFSLITDFNKNGVFNPASYHKDGLNKLLEQLLSWTFALKTTR